MATNLTEACFTFGGIHKPLAALYVVLSIFRPPIYYMFRRQK